MMDFDERVPVGSNMYLPGCTYYVSGTEFSSLPPFLPQTPSSCPMTYSYSTSSLPQVQSVREVSFRDYAIDTSSKWHSRGNLPHCYATEDMVHRDCLSNPGALGDMLSKNNSVLYHSSTSHTSNVYGRNGVLPQAFDQFFETAYGNVENQPSEHPVDRATSKAPPPAERGSDSCRGADETERFNTQANNSLLAYMQLSINKEHHLRIQIVRIHHCKRPLMFLPGSFIFKTVDNSEKKDRELRRHVMSET
uniref:Homeobox A11b n=1 Tax=Cyprinus carpio TaxID=7962 RepID=A0A8C2Q6M7_CYPCA